MTEIVIRDGYFNVTVNDRQGDELTPEDHQKAFNLLSEALRLEKNNACTCAYYEGMKKGATEAYD